MTKIEKEFLEEYRVLPVENRKIVDAFVQKLTEKSEAEKHERGRQK